MQKCVACGVREGRGLNGSARAALPAAALDSGPTPKRRARRPARLGKEGARRPIDPLGDQSMATTSLANRSASVSSEPEATSDGYVGASLCWRYARISLVANAKKSVQRESDNVYFTPSRCTSVGGFAVGLTS